MKSQGSNGRSSVKSYHWAYALTGAKPLRNYSPGVGKVCMRCSRVISRSGRTLRKRAGMVSSGIHPVFRMHPHRFKTWRSFTIFGTVLHRFYRVLLFLPLACLYTRYLTGRKLSDGSTLSRHYLLVSLLPSAALSSRTAHHINNWSSKWAKSDIPVATPPLSEYTLIFSAFMRLSFLQQ